jgi:coenzyme F420-0:L-glutamate ligase / coenzyme F420-1:gamma-L-glutamate ligase
MPVPPPLQLIPLPGIPLVQPGDNVGELITASLKRRRRRSRDPVLTDSDIMVVTSKIISKAEDRYVSLGTVTPSLRALELGKKMEKDPRLVEIILWDTVEVVRAVPNAFIVRHRLGFVAANGGVDSSNVDFPNRQRALRLPEDPDRSAREIRLWLRDSIGASPAVIISDSQGRPWREGTVGVAIGLAGIKATQDLRQQQDLFGRRLLITVVGLADQIAAAATLVSGQGAEGAPVILVRGLEYIRAEETSARDILRPLEKDLFRS